MKQSPAPERDRTPGARLARIPRRTAVVLLTVVAVLVSARIAAPFVIEWYLDRELAHLPDYRGQIEDVDLSLIDGELAVEGLRLDRREGDPEVPLLRVKRIEVDYRWDALLDGAIVADVEVDRPVLNLMPAATRERDPGRQLDRDEEGAAITEAVQALLPTKIHHLHVRNGALRFKDVEASPDVDLQLGQVNLLVSNLSNRPSSREAMPTRGRLSARLQKSGKLRARFRLNIYAEHPTFDLDLALRGLDVRELNDFARAYAGADLESGRAAFYTELIAKDGRIKGYFKPMLDAV
ncbi:MAG TPA: DUF748 domain-containing protein, partial [Kofleriaceae bacterium]|nr:DUF748 domain-containing protein [Kofleriaceae bacterium]